MSLFCDVTWSGKWVWNQAFVQATCHGIQCPCNSGIAGNGLPDKFVVPYRVISMLRSIGFDHVNLGAFPPNAHFANPFLPLKCCVPESKRHFSWVIPYKMRLCLITGSRRGKNSYCGINNNCSAVFFALVFGLVGNEERLPLCHLQSQIAPCFLCT